MLGARWSSGRTFFSVFAPYAREVSVKIYDSGGGALIRKERLTKSGEGIWSAECEGDLDGKYYLYEIDGRDTVDPYALSTDANAAHGAILDMRRTDPEGWDEDEFEACSPVIWELHVRDFSSDPYLGLKDAGKYSAFRTGVVTPGGKSALVDYIAELGVTYVHLLPVLDFAVPDERDGRQYNWGYDPVLYFSPEGSYSSDPDDAMSRVRELKQLVKTLHGAGIGVIFDVVYNHTYTVEGGALENCAPGYYYRRDENGKLCNGSGCGNETASERKMFRRLMTDSVLHLAKEYHADGFRFDLMGLHDVDTINGIRKALDDAFPDGRGKKILMYGEPWYCAPPKGIAGADVGHIRELSERIAIFNGFARDGIRGRHYGGLRKGYVEGELSSLEKAMSGILGGTRGIDGDADSVEVKKACQQILYCACHDDYTLYDHISAVTEKGFDVERAQCMAAFMLMSGYGIPLIQAGEEFCRTKYMDGNSYRSSDAVNKLDWKRRELFDQTVSYYKGLIALRKGNKAYEDLTADPREVCKRIGSPDGTAVYYVGEHLYCVNNTDRPVKIKFTGRGTVLADIRQADPEGLYRAEGEVSVEAHGVTAFLPDEGRNSVITVE